MVPWVSKYLVKVAVVINRRPKSSKGLIYDFYSWHLSTRWNHRLRCYIFILCTLPSFLILVNQGKPFGFDYLPAAFWWITMYKSDQNKSLGKSSKKMPSVVVHWYAGSIFNKVKESFVCNSFHYDQRLSIVYLMHVIVLYTLFFSLQGTISVNGLSLLLPTSLGNHRNNAIVQALSSRLVSRASFVVGK